MTRDQRPFLHPESLQDTSNFQLHVGDSSHEFHPLSFSIGSGQGTAMAMAELVFCSVTHFCFEFDVCFCIIVLL